MSLVNAKCVNCGANIQADDAKDAGFCQYCGSAFVTEKVINHYHAAISAETVIIGADFDNLIKIANEAWNAKDYQNAYGYYSKAYEIRPDDKSVMLQRALSRGRLFTENDYNFNIVISAFDTAFKSSSQTNEDTMLGLNALIEFNNLAAAFISAVKSNHQRHIAKIKEELNREEIKEKERQQRHAERHQGAEGQNPAAIIDSPIIRQLNKDISDAGSRFIGILNECIAVQNKIVIWYETVILNSPIHNKEAYIKFLKNQAQLYADIISAGSSGKPNKEQLKALNEKIKELDPDHKPIKAGFCYIATAVYGSYDCPEVWILRRYRDNTLSKNILGRLYIKIYYALSPVLLKLFADNAGFKKFCKNRLENKIKKLTGMTARKNK